MAPNDEIVSLSIIDNDKIQLKMVKNLKMKNLKLKLRKIYTYLLLKMVMEKKHHIMIIE